MNSVKNFKSYKLFIVIGIFITYLLLGTGIHGDDYTIIYNMLEYDIWKFLNPGLDDFRLMIFNLISYYSFWWAFPVFGYDNQLGYDIIKVVAHGAGIYFTYMFFQDYVSRDRALLASIIFIFYPLHDTTTYWYMTLPYMLTPAVLLYGHHLIKNNKFKIGFFTTFLGAFASYAAPPYVFGLTAIFVLEKKFKKAVIYATPGILYLIYYFSIKLIFPESELRINSELDIISFFKHFLLQPISILEASIGPSYWFKVIYSVGSMSMVSMLIAGVTMYFFLRFARLISTPSGIYNPLLIGIISVLFLSFAMFALTGMYSHSAFNLGNRTTVYVALLISYLLVALIPSNKKAVIFVSIIFLLPVIGISDHWKEWNDNQKDIIVNINKNDDLKLLPVDSTLVVVGNTYSNLGPFSHIEFFSMSWIVSSHFRTGAGVKSENIVALTSYIKFQNDSLVDIKYNNKYSLGENIYVYNTETDSLNKITMLGLRALVSQENKEIRHWVQLLKDTWLQELIISLSPRLVYLFR